MDLEQKIKELEEINENIEFENTVFETHLIRVQGNADIPKFNEDLQISYYDQTSLSLGDIVDTLVSNMPPGSQSSKRSGKSSTTGQSAGQQNQGVTLFKLTAEQKCDIVVREI